MAEEQSLLYLFAQEAWFASGSWPDSCSWATAGLYPKVDTCAQWSSYSRSQVETSQARHAKCSLEEGLRIDTSQSLGQNKNFSSLKSHARPTIVKSNAGDLNGAEEIAIATLKRSKCC